MRLDDRHPYFTLKAVAEPVLQTAGLTQLAEVPAPEAFGSVHATFGTDRPRVRLIWDGKDGMGYAQRFTPQGTWVDLPVYMREEDLVERASPASKVVAFRARLREAAAPDAA